MPRVGVMGHENRCMLFAPPGPPLRLDSEREVVIGRSRSCELTLHVGQASRRHAVVRFEDGDFRRGRGGLGNSEGNPRRQR